MDIKEIGNRIKQARSLRNYTLDDVAGEIGVAKSTIQRYENGLINKPKLPILQAIAESLRVNPAWLCGQEVPMTCEDSLENIIKNRLTENKITLEDVALKSNVPYHWLKNIDTFIPGSFGDTEIGYEWISRVAETLGLPPSKLRAALARQEAPLSEEGSHISAVEAFGEPQHYMGENERKPHIMSYYNQLNSLGQETATEQVRLLTLDKKYTDKLQDFPSTVQEPQANYLTANAAHERTDTTFTDEERKADEDMLD